MRTEVYINNLLFDLDDETTVAASYGNISFGSLQKRKGVKSNVWAGPFSQRNKLIAESCEVPGSYSLIPYRKNLIRVEIDGVIVFEGFCSFEECKESYQVQSFAGASDFYSIVTSKKLATLDLSQYDHVWNQTNIINSWLATDGYIYAFVEYGQNWPSFSNFPPAYLLPQIFFHTVVRQIAADAGYTLMGDVLTNPRFLRHMIIPNVFPVPIMYGGMFSLSAILPDLTQSKIWLDFANIYGLQFDVNDLTKEIYANYIDDILFNDPEDWSNKVDNSEDVTTTFKIDNTYQTSTLKYKSETYNPAKLSGDAYQDFRKDVTIDNENLPLAGDIYKSEFFLIQNASEIRFPPNTFTTLLFEAKIQLFYGFWRNTDAYIQTGIVWHQGTFYQAADGGVAAGVDPPTNPDFWEPKKESDIWEIKLRPMYGALIIDPNSTRKVEFPASEEFVTRIITNFEMDWPTTFDRHYRVFERVIDRTKVIEPLMKLNYSDVNQLKFEKAKVINNELYFLESVVQYKMNQVDSTICNLVRI